VLPSINYIFFSIFKIFDDSHIWLVWLAWLAGSQIVITQPKVDQTVSEYIECCRLMNPSIYWSEIRQRLLLDGVVHPIDIPSVSQINRHAMTRKRTRVVPCESTTPSATEAVDAFFNEISNFTAPKLHFLDESSVKQQQQEIESMVVLFSENLPWKFNDTHPIQTTQ